jgi:hypothetical protein
MEFSAGVYENDPATVARRGECSYSKNAPAQAPVSRNAWAAQRTLRNAY